MHRGKKIGIKRKLLWAYGILAVLPMLLITVYTYYRTRNILVEQLNGQLAAKLEQDVQMIDKKIDRLYYVSNSFFIDNLLYNYLTMDYSEHGYEDLYYYVWTQLSRVRSLYPEIERLSIYSTNDTLPQDFLYLYLLDGEALEEWNRYADGNGNDFQAVVLEEGYLSFIRRLNLYESGSYEMFLRLDIKESGLSDILQDTGNGASILRDRQGTVLAAVGNESVLQELLQGEHQPGLLQGGLQPGEAGEPAESHPDCLSLSGETKYCGVLTHLEDIGVLQKQAGYSASRVFMVFLAALLLAFGAIYVFSSYFQRNVQSIIDGAREIGAGKLTHKIPVVSRDELGEVAWEVNQLGEKLNTLIEDSYKKEIARIDADLNLLQEQINPHFLYNALSSISSLAKKESDGDTCRAILCLSDFYRISLNKGKKILTVREEISLLESYLAVQRFRFGDMIQVEYGLEEELLDKEIIKLILQPVVENAIHHGRYDDNEVFHIDIRLFSQGDRMVFTVSDDGRGIEMEALQALQESMEQAQNGMGLRNVNARIRLQYGGQYGVRLESQPYLGTVVRLELPLEAGITDRKK